MTNENGKNPSREKPEVGDLAKKPEDDFLLDDEAFIAAVEAGFEASGSPRVDDVTRQRVWGRIESSLSAHRRRRWWPVLAAVPVAAAVAFFVMVSRESYLDVPGDGVKGAGEWLPVEMELMEVLAGNRFAPLDLSVPARPGTEVALMIRGPAGKRALFTRQVGSQAHEVLVSGHPLQGTAGELLVIEQVGRDSIARFALVEKGQSVRFCAVASARGTQSLDEILPVLLKGGGDLPAMMQCISVQIGDEGVK